MIFIQIIHTSSTNWAFFWYERSSLKRSFHSRFKGPRVPKKPQFIHEGPDFKLTCDGRTCGCHGHVAKEKDDAYW
jgi:hypothetical protein